MRNWTGKGSHHHGVVRRNESPLLITLSWHIKATGSTHIKEMKLDLEDLLKKKHVCLEPNTHEKKVRLRFFRDSNGGFFIQAKGDLPSLSLDKISS